MFGAEAPGLPKRCGGKLHRNPPAEAMGFRLFYCAPEIRGPAAQLHRRSLTNLFLRLHHAAGLLNFFQVHNRLALFINQRHELRTEIANRFNLTHGGASGIPSLILTPGNSGDGGFFESRGARLDNSELSPVSILRVPGSSANLGPGFDALGIALQVYLECRFFPSEKLSIRVKGRDADMISPRGEDNLIWQTAQAVATRAHMTLPPVSLEIINDIPLGKGLGSSAAALTAGVIIAETILGLGWKPGRILDEAARLEGHPDNVAASVLGSIVASATEPGGNTRAVRLPMPKAFQVAVVVPNFQLPTKEARAVLPDTYSRADATFNIQRAALLIAALATGDATAFPTALDDRLHQPFRSQLVPGLTEILRLRAPGLLGCTLSGAGPAVLVFYERGCEHVCDLVRQVFAMNGCTTEVIGSGVAERGFELL